MATVTQEAIEAELKRIEGIAEADRTPVEAALLVAGRNTGNEHMIPKSRLDEVLAAKKKAEDTLAALQKAEEDRKKEKLDEVERLKLELKEAQDLGTAKAKELQSERLLNKVISEAGKAQFGEDKLAFIDADDAHRFLDLTPETKTEEVLAMLEKVAKAKPHLLNAKETEQGDRVGSPRKGKQVSQESVQANIVNKKRSTYSPL